MAMLWAKNSHDGSSEGVRLKIGVSALVGALALVLSTQAFAQNSGRIDVSDLPEAASSEPISPAASSGSSGNAGPATGRRAAQKYMGQGAPNDDGTSASAAGAKHKDPHYLAVHIGGFVGDNAYYWGSQNATSNVGRLNIGATYRLGEWENAADLDVRVDYQTFNLPDGSANKLSFLPLIELPDAASKFPLYLGVGAGVGVFTTQLSGESPLSLDYQLLAGIRFFNIRGSNAGVFAEAGIKNHILIFSNGQFNGEFVALGGIFTF